MDELSKYFHKVPEPAAGTDVESPEHGMPVGLAGGGPDASGTPYGLALGASRARTCNKGPARPPKNNTQPLPVVGDYFLQTTAPFGSA